MNGVGKKIQEMAVFVEFLVGSGLAIFFHVVLHNEQASYIIFGTGVLLALATYLVREEVEKSGKALLGQYQQVHDIPFAMAKITDQDCHSRAQDVVAATMRTLTLLQQGYIPLDETEFYLEGARLSDGAALQIKAVDPLTTGWLSRGALVNFYSSNVRAMERGVSITRIFITSRAEINEPEIQKILLSQYRDSIDVRIAFREELPNASDISGRDTNGSFDFAIYDDRAVTDVFVQPGKFYGRKTARGTEVAKYLHLFDLIEHSAHLVVEEEGRIVIASEKMALAS